MSNGSNQCRASDGVGSPLEELEVALDAMSSMQAPFFYRYQLYSAVDRRVGGQGVVQLAAIADTRDQVCLNLPSNGSLPRTEGFPLMCV